MKACKDCKKKDGKIKGLLNINKNLADSCRTKEIHVKVMKKKVFESTYFLVIIILILIGINIVTYQFDKTIDEDEFCREIVNNYFPEYTFETITYHESSNTCIGKYFSEGNNEVRNDIRELTPPQEITKEFELINKDKINYLASDDNATIWVGIGFTMVAIGIILILILILILIPYGYTKKCGREKK